MRKIIFCDLDGTLLNNQKEITSLTKNTIKELKKRGVEFIIATGRGYLGAKNFKDILEIESEIICNNGSTIYDKEGNKIFEKLIDKKISKTIFNLCLNNSTDFLATLGENMYLTQNTYDKILNYLKEEPFKPVVVSPEELHKINFEKIVLLDNNYDNLKKYKIILDENFQQEIKSFISQHNFLDIVNSKCSKGIAMEYLANIKGYTLEETLAFGDAFNDLEMLQMAGEGVIMANGFKELHNIIEKKALPNSEDGVARYLIDYFNLYSVDKF